MKNLKKTFNSYMLLDCFGSIYDFEPIVTVSVFLLKKQEDIVSGRYLPQLPHYLLDKKLHLVLIRFEFNSHLPNQLSQLNHAENIFFLHKV